MGIQELYDWILDNLQSKLELVEVGRRNPVEKWCYPLGDYSGRDFYKYTPIEYLDDDTIEELNTSVWDDFTYEFEDTDEGFEDTDDEDMFDEFDDIFKQVFDSLVDENLDK